MGFASGSPRPCPLKGKVVLCYAGPEHDESDGVKRNMAWGCRLAVPGLDKDSVGERASKGSGWACDADRISDPISFSLYVVVLYLLLPFSPLSFGCIMHRATTFRARNYTFLANSRWRGRVSLWAPMGVHADTVLRHASILLRQRQLVARA